MTSIFRLNNVNTTGSASSCCPACDVPSNDLVRGVLNQSPDVLNRSSYLSTPYSSAPSLNNITPSYQSVVGPLAGCTPGTVGGAFRTAVPGLPSGGQPSAPSGPVSPVSSGRGGTVPLQQIITPGGGPTFGTGPGAGGNMPIQQVIGAGGQPLSSSAPMQQTMQQSPTPMSSMSALPVSNVSAIPGASTQGGPASLQRFNVSQPDNTAVVGIPPSTKNLLKATGESKCADYSQSCDNTFSDAVFSSFQNCPPCQPCQQAPPPAPVASAQPSGPVLATSTLFSGQFTNVGAAPGIAFGNECGTGYGLNTPLAIQGPVSPQTTVLGSTYQERFAYQPYYSGANFSEPAAVMNSANPTKPGYMMLARTWDGTPQMIISKPDRFGCPSFETIAPFEDHGEDCECERCCNFNIDFCEYNCINGFGEEQPNSTSLSVNGLGVSTASIQFKDFYFILYPIVGSNAGSSQINCLNTNGYSIGVNNKIGRNIIMYKGVTYNIIFNYDKDTWPNGTSLPNQPSPNLRLCLTYDPCGSKCGLDPACRASLILPGFPVQGVPFGARIKFTPTVDNFPDCITTVYYQLCFAPDVTPAPDVAFAGGAITIL